MSMWNPDLWTKERDTYVFDDEVFVRPVYTTGHRFGIEVLNLGESTNIVIPSAIVARAAADMNEMAARHFEEGGSDD